jgi:hypothetical protein
LIGSAPIRELETTGGNSAFALSGLSNLFTTQSGGDQGRANAVTITPSPKKLKKAGKVKLTVKVSPSVVGAPVTLLKRTARSARWSEVTVPGGAITKGSSTYTVSVTVKETTLFVAQWRGDADNNGDGSPVTTIAVPSRKKK